MRMVLLEKWYAVNFVANFYQKIARSASSHHLPDTNQNAWALSFIQLTGIVSLPLISGSLLILQNSNFFNALIVLMIANILLWIIRYGIIAMSYDGRKSAMDITYEYVGKWGAFVIAIILLVATLAWFIAQTTMASNSLIALFRLPETPGISLGMQLSAFIGGLSTFICMRGIVWLRRLSIVAFPVLLVVFGLLLFLAPPMPAVKFEKAPLVLSGLSLILGTNLGITSDLPTFFRHSRSWTESLKGLALLQLFSFLIGVGGLFLGTIIVPHSGVSEGIVGYERLLLVILIALSVVCANVANVYSSSVGWEVLAPKSLIGQREYMLLGFGLTMIFITMSDMISSKLLVDIADISLINLCLLLFFGFIMSLVLKRLPSKHEQGIYFGAWCVATIFNLMQYFSEAFCSYSPLIIANGVMIFTIALGFTCRRFFKKR